MVNDLHKAILRDFIKHIIWDHISPQMFVNLIIALSNWILLLLFLFLQGGVSGIGMMKMVQFNISSADKCVCFHHCSSRHSKGAGTVFGSTVHCWDIFLCVFNHITVPLQYVQRTFAHKEIYTGHSVFTLRQGEGHRLDSCIYSLKTRRKNIYCFNIMM